ncbi:MAG: hypothetical protein HPY44_16845 [Armatimonadetes bacterium]|nr:hypothetical protein [Armatimonadota bacterium]
MDVVYRDCDATRDAADIQRIWEEIGWIEPGREGVGEAVASAYRGLVAELDGHVESFAFRSPGVVHHLREPIPFCGIMAVGTSYVARRQGFAARLTSAAVARGVEDGAMVAGLGMFEQGFYNRLGFGTGAREIYESLNPGDLRISTVPRPPVRLGADDFEALHRARLRRIKQHGAVSFDDPQITRLGLLEHRNGYGLGYRDHSGEITHAMWLHAERREHGPLEVRWMAYQEYRQMMELLALLKALGDQVYTVRLYEPRAIQLQDLVSQPFSTSRVREGGKHETDCGAVAWWQMRICDLAGCLERTHLINGTTRFNLVLDDPIQQHLDEREKWSGISGEYTVTLGPESGAVRGIDAKLPTLRATVNAFTRLWLGVRPATGLAVTDSLEGPPELLEELDRVLCLPQPTTDWGF